MPEAELQYLQHNLQLLLQQAQWALLHDEPAIYQSSLQQFQESVQTNFASDSVITQTIMQTINQLKKIDFPTFPLNLNAILEVLYTIKATPPTAMTTANQKETS